MLKALRLVGIAAVCSSSSSMVIAGGEQTMESASTNENFISAWVSDTPLDKVFPNNKFEGIEVSFDPKQKPEGEENSDNEVKGFENPYSDADMQEFIAKELQYLTPKVVDVNEEAPKEEEEEDPNNEKHPEGEKEGGDNRRRLNVFIPDSRQPANVWGFPGRVVGLLIFPGGSCTGELVGASHTLITNAHCVELGSIQNWFQNARILLGFQSLNGVWTSTGIGWFRRVTTVTNGYDGLDYAVIHVEPANDGLQSANIWPMGNFLGVHVPANDALEDDPFLVNQFAYSGDQISNFGNMVGRGTVNQRMHLGCSTRGEAFFGSDILHDCDCKKGSSGSALINNANQVLALNHAQRYGNDAERASQTYPAYRDGVANLANNIADVVGWIRAYNGIPRFTLSPTARPTAPTASPTYPTPRPTRPIVGRKVTPHPTPRFTAKVVTPKPTKKFTEKFLG